jgi:hypothetical protein
MDNYFVLDTLYHNDIGDGLVPGSKRVGLEFGRGCKVLEIDGVDPKRALFEIRDGKFWDGEPATRKEDGTPKQDGFYLVELTSDGNILNDNIYGPYADVVEAELTARAGYTLTDVNRAITELERQGRIRRVVGEDGVHKTFEQARHYNEICSKISVQRFHPRIELANVAHSLLVNCGGHGVAQFPVPD